jgi:cytoskeletal protein RodZ
LFFTGKSEMVIFTFEMKIQQAIVILKISFLLTLFGSATFYFQYTSPKKIFTLTSSKSDDSKKSSSNNLPLAEEESENEKSTSEEEEQDDDRAFHHQEVFTDQNISSIITLSTISILDFKEIHFEIVTPPPQD